MIEKHIILEDIDPVVFYGANNCHMQMIKALFPKLRIIARDNVIKVMGEEGETSQFERFIAEVQAWCNKYNSLKDEVILEIFNGNRPVVEKEGDVIVFSISGRPITPRTENQLRLVKAYEQNDIGMLRTTFVDFYRKALERMGSLCEAYVKAKDLSYAEIS